VDNKSTFCPFYSPFRDSLKNCLREIGVDYRARDSKFFGSDKCYKPSYCGGGSGKKCCSLDTSSLRSGHKRGLVPATSSLKSLYGLLTKREVKMAGYWPSSFFACLWAETKSRSINSQKKNEANIQPF